MNMKDGDFSKNGYWVSFWDNKNVLKLDYGNGLTDKTHWITLNEWMYNMWILFQ